MLPRRLGGVIGGAICVFAALLLAYFITRFHFLTTRLRFCIPYLYVFLLFCPRAPISGWPCMAKSTCRDVYHRLVVCNHRARLDVVVVVVVVSHELLSRVRGHTKVLEP